MHDKMHYFLGTIHLLSTEVMPQMNGRDLTEKILSICPGMKRLFIAGYTADVIAHHGVAIFVTGLAAMVRTFLDSP